METVGFRNIQLVNELAADGRLSKPWGEDGETFDPMQYALLAKLASATYDWPFDEKAAAHDPFTAPRVYTRGWLALARDLGMVYARDLDEVETIGGEPRAPRREKQAVKRISQTAGRLEKAGLLRLLRPGSVQRKNNAVWMLAIGSPDENMRVEAFARDRLRIQGKEDRP